MKVLFVCSGNYAHGISPIIQSQAESLTASGISVEYYLIQGSGAKGYLKNVLPLKRMIERNEFNIIHAHYGFSAWLARLANSNIPLVVSLMGSDAYGDFDSKGNIKKGSFLLIYSAKIIAHYCDAMIVKSNNIADKVSKRIDPYIIANGVNIDLFKPFDKGKARNILGLENEEHHLLFLGDKNNERKNISLMKEALKYLKDVRINIMNPYPVEHEKVPTYINASDALLLTSTNEGSPNAIKEAMACNCPVVSTNVGDVEWLLGNLDGHYTTSFSPDDVASQIRIALEFAKTRGKTEGRKRIIELGLDSKSVAKEIISVYEKVVK